MKKKWINRQGNPACIIFFNGWGMDEHVLNDFDHSGFDVCHLNDFSSIDPLATEEFQYNKIIIVAWSLGVCAANEILSKSGLKINQSFAINGTPWPWHDELAISHATFKQTLVGWNDRNRFKFNLRMFGGKSSLENASLMLSQRCNDDQHQELQFFYDLGHQSPDEKHQWTAAFVGMNDQIVPALHQLNFWSGRTQAVKTNWPHFPFSEIKSWYELLKITEQC